MWKEKTHTPSQLCAGLLKKKANYFEGSCLEGSCRMVSGK